MVKSFVDLLRRYKKTLIIIGGLGALLLVGPTLYANMGLKNTRYNLNGTRSIPKRDVVIVLGAGVNPDGSPTEYLRNRLETAAELYGAGKTQKILVSGDNSSKKYDEPTAMKRYLMRLGMPAQDIVVDYAGFNTYDTCYRAKAIFGVRSALIVTQGYHLPRAVWTCRSLGVDTLGVAAKRQGRDFTVSYIIREYVSTSKAVIQLLFKPTPTVLGPHERIAY